MPPQGPRYYLYVSDTKLDMLAEQIPRGLLSGLAAELQIDLKVVGVSLREKPSEQTRYSKLAVVEAYLHQHGSVGSVDDPAAYFGGTLPLRWGTIADNVVYFTGDGKRTVLGLTGSLRHVIGHDAPQIVEWGIGSFPSSLESYARDLDVEDEEAVTPDALRATVETAAANFLAPEQDVHFLARRLMYSTASDWTRTRQRFPNHAGHLYTLLGTPIYVALAD
jgi:hypothetical protein